MRVDHVLFAVAGLRKPTFTHETSERLTTCMFPKVVLYVARLIEHFMTSVDLTCVLHSEAAGIRVLNIGHFNPLARYSFEALLLGHLLIEDVS